MYKLHQYQTNLVNKARQKISNGAKSVLLVSPAGSGKSVIIAAIAKSAVDKGGHVMFMVHRKELVEQIAETFRTAEIDLSHTTIMTVGRIKNRLDKLPKPTLIITDETHHSLAKTYRDIYEYYPDVARLGFTATPWRMNGKGFDEVYDEMVEGPTVRWLIDNHYLAPYKYFSVNVIDADKLKRSSTGDYTKQSMDEAVGKTIFGDVIQTYRSKAEGQQTIVYAHSIDFSKKITQMFNDAGIAAKHADSKTPAKERDTIMQDFKDGKIKVLCNVDLISEGFNVPDCSCVIMLRPTQSLVLDVQQSMRCMRYKPNKLATIIDHVANYTRFGLPDTSRSWTLSDREKKKSSGTKSIVSIKTCPECFSVIPGELQQCPNCDYVFETVRQEMEVDDKAEIEEITSFPKLVKNSLATKKPSEATSFKELQEMAKAKGYKIGWAYYQAKIFNLI